MIVGRFSNAVSFVAVALLIGWCTPKQQAQAQTPAVQNTAAEKSPVKKKTRERKKVSGYGESSALIEIFLTESSLRSKLPSETAFRIERKARLTEDRMNVLVYHVDYLNDRGWKDPFSSPEFSDRQRRYSQSFKHPRAEPEMAVINGNVYSPANQFDLVMFNVRRVLKKRPKVGLEVATTYVPENDEVVFDFDVPGTKRMRREFLKFNVALVSQDHLSTVKDGPNKDYTFRHTNTVLQLQSVRFGKEGKGELRLIIPRETDRDALAMIYFVQDPKTLEIWQSGRVTLKELLSKESSAKAEG